MSGVLCDEDEDTLLPGAKLLLETFLVTSAAGSGAGKRRGV
jgi:hypothetical protein